MENYYGEKKGVPWVGGFKGLHHNGLYGGPSYSLEMTEFSPCFPHLDFNAQVDIQIGLFM